MKQKWKKVRNYMGAILIKIFSVKTDYTHEDWYRLEYRNEYVTRDAEKMNYFGIR